MERYSRQILFSRIGEQGQNSLLDSRVLIVGCGALGTVIANNLARSGVGYIRIVDRDFVELSNIQRQVLFDEEDVKHSLPKAVAAEKKLKQINSDIEIEGIVADVNAKNIEKFCKDIELILDGTDNFAARYLINDVSVKHKIPWIYGGAVGSIGMVYPIIPEKTPCFRCLFPNPPSAGFTATCDTSGVLNGVTSIVASIQSTEAVKILTGRTDDIARHLWFFDIWDNIAEKIEIARNSGCPACSGKNLEFLKRKTDDAVLLCGKGIVQVNPIGGRILPGGLIERLERAGLEIESNRFSMKFSVDEIHFTVFFDGRAIIKNVSGTEQAKTLYAKYIGS